MSIMNQVLFDKYLKLKEERAAAMQREEQLPKDAPQEERWKASREATAAAYILNGFIVAIRLIDTDEAKAIIHDYDEMMGFNKWEK